MSMGDGSNSLLSNCSNLTDYLRTLPAQILSSLYTHPATCMAVFRELPSLAQMTVNRLLYVDQEIPKAVVQSWVVGREKEKEATEALSGLGVWQECSSQGGVAAWRVNDMFKKNLKIALLGGGHPWSGSSRLEADPHKRDVAFLDAYSSERWNTILHYMVGSAQQEGISKDAVAILSSAQLVVNEGGSDGSPSITRSGFQFLLMDTPSQVWYFILQYLNNLHNQNMNLNECLNFLFQLSFSELGKDYSTVGLSNTLLTFLQHLREFGLVYQRKRSAGRFYPTRLALNIASGEKKSLLERHREGYLVVETNYRVYAYTSSDLQVALIGLFAELICRFPNLAVALITRDSIRTALRGGITAVQISRFLKMHAHPQQQQKHAKKGSGANKAAGSNAADEDVIPPTVIDQIYLWENERNRFTFTDGVLYNQFLSQNDFDRVRHFAEGEGVCVWSNAANRTIVVSRQGHDEVKRFWRQQR